jgi:predicted DCC family thiol-disulfide oxidoreductase YuxK
MSKSRPLLIFDGNCGFCRIWVRYWQKLTDDRIHYAPSAEVKDEFPEIPNDAFQKSVWLAL